MKMVGNHRQQHGLREPVMRAILAESHVLDEIMLQRALSHSAKSALDVGCGEGRFCRFLTKNGIETCGVDPVPEMISEARRCHQSGNYLQGFGEKLQFDEASFDLVVSYLSLIDIDNADAAISEMARVVKPGGHILVANLTSFSTSCGPVNWRTCKDTGEKFRPLGFYLQEQKDWFEWDGLRIGNWHRPLSHYMKWFLSAGLTLTYFDEPSPKDVPADEIEKYHKVPYFMVMEWRK